jgi:hypothetical protein
MSPSADPRNSKTIIPELAQRNGAAISFDPISAMGGAIVGGASDTGPEAKGAFPARGVGHF